MSKNILSVTGPNLGGLNSPKIETFVREDGQTMAKCGEGIPPWETPTLVPLPKPSSPEYLDSFRPKS
jgi:hypothetical protein